MATPDDEQLYRADGWPGGVNNRLRETETGIDRNGDPGAFLREALNVDITAEGTPLRRAGYAQQVSGFCHSLWRHHTLPFALMVKDSELVKVSGPEPLIESLGPIDTLAPVSFDAVNHTVYFSNGVETGLVTMAGERRPWGLPSPPSPDIAVDSGYNLNPGCYQVALTYTDAQGEESGASEPVQIDAPLNAGLEVTLPALPSGVSEINVYVTEANGEIFYRALSRANAGTVLVSQTVIGRGRTLETLHMERPFPGRIVRHHKGRLYIATGDALFFTEPLRYGLIQAARSVYLYPADITLLEPVDDGIFVGYGDSVEFISGTNPYDAQRRAVSSRGVVPGTGTQIPGHILNVDDDYAPVWWSQRGGLVVGSTGGTTRALTENRLAVQKYGAGAIMAREQEGMSQLVTALRNPGGGSAGATDSVVAEIRRTNVT